MEVMIRTPFGVTTLDLSARQAADLMKQALEYAAQEGNEPRHVPPAGNGGVSKGETSAGEPGKEEEKMAESIKRPPARNSRVENLFGSKSGWYAPAAALPEDEPEKTLMADPEPEQEREAEESRWYKGFLRVKCEKCGKVKAFCAKKPTRCNVCECGHRTELKDLRTLKFRCECGKQFTYQTNERDSHVTVECLECGTPNDLLWRANKNGYVSAKAVVW